MDKHWKLEGSKRVYDYPAMTIAEHNEVEQHHKKQAEIALRKWEESDQMKKDLHHMKEHEYHIEEANLHQRYARNKQVA